MLYYDMLYFNSGERKALEGKCLQQKLDRSCNQSDGNTQKAHLVGLNLCISDTMNRPKKHSGGMKEKGWLHTLQSDGGGFEAALLPV